MKQHLSSEQIARWMTGERTAAEEHHARECSECAAELARMEGTLSLFRGAVHELSEQQGGAAQTAWTVERASHGWRFQPMRWALACAVLLILAAMPLYHNAKERQRKADMARADAALLEQVDAEISRAVPATMEPLVKLVAFDPSATSEQGERQTKQKGGIIQ
ncbi:MAG TPA: hypothetical protein VGV35_09305 [Bryobacteraceae bacterium]|nr:hypothetical protein [Bryobacteraceae bacterium]